MEGKHNKNVGKYLVTSQVLGQGSFSTVFKAYDESRRPLAVKVLSQQLLHNQHTCFRQEVNSMRKCSHHNVVKLVDVMKSKTNVYLFIQFCPGGTLEALLKKGPLPQAQAMNYFAQIVKGLQVLGASGVVHRDLKPANILISGNTIKIADFGLAKKYVKGDLLTSYKGSPLNMAPEIVQGLQYTNIVDLYSAGTILYQCLYAISPFSANSQQETDRRAKQKLYFPSQIEVSKAVKKLLQSMLQWDPEGRIQLNGVLECIKGYWQRQRGKRLQEYKQIARSVIGGVGVTGALLAAFKCAQSPRSPFSMDLKLYGRLCHRLSTRA